MAVAVVGGHVLDPAADRDSGSGVQLRPVIDRHQAALCASCLGVGPDSRLHDLGQKVIFALASRYVTPVDPNIQRRSSRPTTLK